MKSIIVGMNLIFISAVVATFVGNGNQFIDVFNGLLSLLGLCCGFAMILFGALTWSER